MTYQHLQTGNLVFKRREMDRPPLQSGRGLVHVHSVLDQVVKHGEVALVCNQMNRAQIRVISFSNLIVKIEYGGT